MGMAAILVMIYFIWTNSVYRSRRLHMKFDDVSSSTGADQMWPWTRVNNDINLLFSYVFMYSLRQLHVFVQSFSSNTSTVSIETSI